MFYYCSGLTSLDLSSFDTSKVTDISDMFQNCYKLTSITFGNNFDTSNVTNMGGMFQYCSGLTSLNLSNFDTSAVTNMSNMFYNCSKLTFLDLSSFDTSKVTNMYYMFRDCSKLISITFGYKANVSKVTSYSYIFYNVPSTCTLTLCENTRNSWNKLISSYTLNVVENEC